MLSVRWLSGFALSDRQARVEAALSLAWSAAESMPGLAWYAAALQDAAGRLRDWHLGPSEVERRVSALEATAGMMGGPVAQGMGPARPATLEIAAARAFGHLGGWPTRRQ